MGAKAVGQVLLVWPGRVRPLPGQPREYFDPVKLRRLERSIKASGQHTSATVIPVQGDPNADYELTDGQRRWHACKKLGIQIKVEVRHDIKTREEQFLASVISNFSREDNTPLEIAKAIARIRKMERISKLERSKQAEAIAELFGRSTFWVYQYENLLRLHPTLQRLMDPAVTPQDKLLSMTVAAEFASLSHERQIQVHDEIVTRKLTRDSARSYVRRLVANEGVTRDGKKIGQVRDDRVFITALSKFEQMLTSGGLNFRRAFAAQGSDVRRTVLAKIDEVIGELGEVRDEIASAGETADLGVPEPEKATEKTAGLKSHNQPAISQLAPVAQRTEHRVDNPKVAQKQATPSRLETKQPVGSTPAGGANPPPLQPSKAGTIPPGSRLVWSSKLNTVVWRAPDGTEHQPSQTKAAEFKPQRDGLRGTYERDV